METTYLKSYKYLISFPILFFVLRKNHMSNFKLKIIGRYIILIILYAIVINFSIKIDLNRWFVL